MGISMKTTTGKILASVALVGTAAAVAGMGTYGAFSSSTSASAAVAAGTVKIALGAPGATNTLSVPVAGVLPGDTVEKLVTLANTGDSDLNTVSLTTDAGATASALTTESVDGLQLTIENCSVAWAGTAAPYTCAGTKSVVLSSSPVIGANRVLGNLTALKAAKTDYLKVSTTLAGSAPNTAQGATSTIGFTFDGTQRTETVK